MIRHRLALALALLATPVSYAPASAYATEMTPERERELTAQYQQAQDHYLAKRYTEALPLFEQVSTELDSPNAQLYVARCHRELGHVVEAHAAMAQTVEMAQAKAASEPRFAATRDEAAKELAELDALVGRLVVRLAEPPAGLVVEVAGRAVGLDEEVVVAPGEVRVDALVPGRPLHRETVHAKAGAVAEVQLTLPEVAPPPSPLPVPTPAVAPDPVPPPPEPAGTSGGGIRMAGYFVLGASAAGFVTFAVAGVMANQRFSEIEEACGGRCTDPSYNDEIDGGRTMDLIANVGLGLGLGLGVAGALMVIFGGPDEPSSDVGVGVAPLAGDAALLGGGMVTVGGRF